MKFFSFLKSSFLVPEQFQKGSVQWNIFLPGPLNCSKYWRNAHEKTDFPHPTSCA